MRALIVLLSSFLHSGGHCKATIFGFPGDRYAGGNPACLQRKLRLGEIGIAMRHVSCGTPVLLVNPRTHRSIIARVIDHGPYGALFKDHWILKRRASDPGTYRGCIDLTRGAAKALGHNGFESIVYMEMR